MTPAELEEVKIILAKTADLWSDEERKVLATHIKAGLREKLKSIRREMSKTEAPE